MSKNQNTRLFEIVSKCLKYFLLALAGFAIAYVLAISFGAVQMTLIVVPFVIPIFLRLGLILLCLIATTVVLESIQ
jgi:ABC-type multidrug transport system permease subunit